MKTDVLNKRVRVLESRSQADLADDESEKTRLFLDRLTTDELRQALAIAERTHDYELPLTEEERAFWDRIVAKYQTD